MFPGNVYAERRKRLRNQVEAGLILLLGNDEIPMNYPDNPYAFRQDSAFLYFFRLDSPGLAALIDVDEDREVIFGNDLTVEEIIWKGPQPSLRERAAEAGVREIAAAERLQAVLGGAVQQGRQIHLLPLYRPEHVLRIQRLLETPAAKIRDYVSETLIRAVVTQRSTKTQAEVEEIEAALNITHEMHMMAMNMTRPGIYEREVAGAMEGIALSRGGRLAFPAIFSIHGETLHNHFHGNVMKKGDIVVNDSGAESPLHYASDITRTIPVRGRFTQRQREIYTIVLNAQQAAMEAIVPGAEFRNIHRLACETLAHGLKDVGLMKGDTEEAVQAGAHALFFQCGLGHMLGLDVHDMEALGEDYVGYTETIKRNPEFGWSSLRLGKALEPGYVITVEPGVYFIPELIDRWKSERKCAEFINYEKVEIYRGFGGIRLEDDVLVTEAGHRVLGKRIPKTIKEVEDILCGPGKMA